MYTFLKLKLKKEEEEEKKTGKRRTRNSEIITATDMTIKLHFD